MCFVAIINFDVYFEGDLHRCKTIDSPCHYLMDLHSHPLTALAEHDEPQTNYSLHWYMFPHFRI